MAQHFAYTIHINEQYKKDPNVRKKIKEIEKIVGKTGKTTKVAAKKMGDFERAMRRAAIVAPVWMALRTAMMSFLRGFSEGFKYMEEFDRAMIKAQAVVHGALGTMSENVTDLKGRIRDLSKATGESMTNIAEAFYKFGTVGMEFEKAWAGAEASVRIAMATMGDAVKMSKTLALSFKLLGHTIDTGIPSTQAYEIQMAKLYKLWQINAFEANEFTASLQNFLPTANIMNLTMDETNALLATLGSAALQGARGGRLLRTSFSKLLDNTNKLATSLGMYVNPELENSFTLFMRVLKAIKQLSAAQELPLAAQDIIKNIFGGVRGGEPIRGLVALFDELNKNIDITTGGLYEQKKMLEDYNRRVNEVRESVSGQLKIFRELRKQLFEQFITGALGEEEFAKGMIKGNEIMKEVVRNSFKLGEHLEYIGKHPIEAAFRAGLPWVHQLMNKMKELEDMSKKIKLFDEGKLSLKEMIELLPELESKFAGALLFDQAIKRLKEQIKKIPKEALEYLKFQERMGEIILIYDEKHFKKVRDALKLEEELVDVKKNTLKIINLQKKSMKEQVDILKMQSEGYSEVDIAIAKISLEANKLVNEYNSLDAIIDGTVPALNKQVFLTKLLSNEWEDVMDSLVGYPNIQDRILALAKKVNGVELEKQKILNRQKATLDDMAIAYEKADAFDRSRIRRLMELQQMTQPEIERAYRAGGRDQKIIIENLDKFEKAIQEFVTAQITRERDLPRKHPDEMLMDMLDKLVEKLSPPEIIKPKPKERIQQQVNLTGIKNMELNVNITKEDIAEMAEIAAIRLKGALKDPELLRELGIDLPPYFEVKK